MTIAFAIAAAFILIFLGLAGVFLPIIPGVPLAWIGFFIYALATDFVAVPLWQVFLFLGLTVLTILVEFISPIIGAKKYHASRYGIIGSTLGLFFGVFIAGPLGIILGPLVGAFLGEIMFGKRAGEATQAALGTFIGFLVGSILKIAVILAMLGFLIAALF